MHTIFKQTLTALTSFLILNTLANAENTDAYFQALEKIKTPQTDEQAIQPCTETELKDLVALLQNSKDQELKSYKFEQGQIANQWGDTVEAYKGNFSNEHITQYALISTSGTMRSNTVMILENKNGELVNKNLDAVITNKLIPGKDMSEFYMHVATPFAVTKNGRTYLRYMNFPYKQYDASQLQLCTYLWEGSNIKLSGPNWTFDKKSKKMVPYKKCIGAS